LTGLRNA